MVSDHVFPPHWRESQSWDRPSATLYEIRNGSKKETYPETGLVEIFQRHSGSTLNDDDWDKKKWLQEIHFPDR